MRDCPGRAGAVADAISHVRTVECSDLGGMPCELAAAVNTDEVKS
jgi:hypothetical protein